MGVGSFVGCFSPGVLFCEVVDLELVRMGKDVERFKVRLVVEG